MAIGREDTDEIYDAWIKEAIQEAGLRPIRVDRIVHNDRVDHRIREEIRRADVLVAELTYARPSVYWEAGFAEREVPVVYVCRRDHLKQAESDVHGNLAVHFDLRNANIITWSGLGTQAFKDDLAKRLRHVTRGVLQQQDAKRKLLAARENFAKVSQSERRSIISKRSESILQRSGTVRIDAEQGTRTALGPDRLYGDETSLNWARIGGTAFIVGSTRCFARLLKKDLEWSRFAPLIDEVENDRFIAWGWLPTEIRSLTRRRVRRVRRVRIVPVLKRVPEARIQQVFEHYRRLPAVDLYYRRSFRAVITMDRKPRSTSIGIAVHHPSDSA